MSEQWKRKEMLPLETFWWLQKLSMSFLSGVDVLSLNETWTSLSPTRRTTLTLTWSMGARLQSPSGDDRADARATERLAAIP